MAQSADGKVFKIVPCHHLEHSTSNSLSIRALSHDLTGSDRSYFQKLFMSLHAMFAFTQRGGFDQIDKDDSNLPLDTAPIKHVTQIWDVLTNSEVINIVASAPKRSMAAKLLVNHAVRAWKYKYGFKVDDCSSICLFLKD
ncbi:hypothetical protein GLYMA_03G043675v4 [Glycine max]|nr:hypothetical protein GLYMA_03G043675v4 [Glycine max]